MACIAEQRQPEKRIRVRLISCGAVKGHVSFMAGLIGCNAVPTAKAIGGVSLLDATQKARSDY